MLASLQALEPGASLIGAGLPAPPIIATASIEKPSRLIRRFMEILTLKLPLSISVSSLCSPSIRDQYSKATLNDAASTTRRRFCAIEKIKGKRREKEKNVRKEIKIDDTRVRH